jgi:hypothetical protein
MGKACSINGREDECLRDIGGKARRKGTTRNTKMRWLDNTKMNLKRERLVVG